jgi:hypothetical protein
MYISQQTQQSGYDNDHSVGSSMAVFQNIRAGRFYATLDNLRYSATKPDVLEKELLWQQGGKNGNTHAQAAFKEEILAQRSLHTFAIMCKNSPYLTICHSLGKFFSNPSDKAKGFHGKCIAFVGDRDNSRELQMVILPESAWEWITPMVFVDHTALEEFYEPQNRNATKLFPPHHNLPNPRRRRALLPERERKKDQNQKGK